MQEEGGDTKLSEALAKLRFSLQPGRSWKEMVISTKAAGRLVINILFIFLLD